MAVLPKNNGGAAIGAGVVFVLAAVLGTVNQELGAGHIPIPDAYKFLVPIVGSLITALVAILTPRLSSKG